MTDLQLDMIERRRADLTGALWSDWNTEEVGDEVRADLDALIDEVKRLRRILNEKTVQPKGGWQP